MNQLQKFMMGRYGGDQLSLALLIISMRFTFAGRVTKCGSKAQFIKKT